MEMVYMLKPDSVLVLFFSRTHLMFLPFSVGVMLSILLLAFAIIGMYSDRCYTASQIDSKDRGRAGFRCFLNGTAMFVVTAKCS